LLYGAGGSEGRTRRCSGTWINRPGWGAVNERAVNEAAQAFLEKESGVPVHINDAEESGHVKALTALPFKPAIIIE
jgi:hypothetical protein